MAEKTSVCPYVFLRYVCIQIWSLICGGVCGLWNSPLLMAMSLKPGIHPQCVSKVLPPFSKGLLPLVSELLFLRSSWLFLFKWSFYVAAAFYLLCLFCKTFWNGDLKGTESANRKKTHKETWLSRSKNPLICPYLLVCDLVTLQWDLNVPIQEIDELRYQGHTSLRK